MSITIPDELRVASSSPTGAELPAWLHTQTELLHAVMAHPAELIAMALAATGTTELTVLLAWLDGQGPRVTRRPACVMAREVTA